MLPQATVNDTGNATAGTAYGGPFVGPLTFAENGELVLVIDRSVVLQDAICQLSSGASTTQNHAFLISVGTIQNVVGVLYSGTMQPGSAQRSVPKLKFPAGARLYIRSVQISGTTAEPNILLLRWA